jgi:hypothetical protein
MSLVGRLLPTIEVVVCYAVGFGVAESFGLMIPSPSTNWQVPAGWVVRQPLAVRIAIWGAFLGPGLVTRNPYAGMWVAPLMLASTGSAKASIAAGALAGALHGLARGIGVIRNMRRQQCCENFAWLTLSFMRRRFVDGLVLLLVAGIVVVRL